MEFFAVFTELFWLPTPQSPHLFCSTSSSDDDNNNNQNNITHDNNDHDDEYVLRSCVCFAHSEQCIGTAVNNVGYQMDKILIAPICKSNGHDVIGLLMILEKKTTNREVSTFEKEKEPIQVSYGNREYNEFKEEEFYTIVAIVNFDWLKKYPTISIELPTENTTIIIIVKSKILLGICDIWDRIKYTDSWSWEKVPTGIFFHSF